MFAILIIIGVPFGVGIGILILLLIRQVYFWEQYRHTYGFSEKESEEIKDASKLLRWSRRTYDENKQKEEDL